MANINAPIIPNAVMLDRVIGEIQQGLVDNLPWLDAAFGRSQRLTKDIQGKRVVTPNVFCGGWRGHGENDYIEVSPDSKIGNFAFFEVEDPQTIDPGPWARQIKTPFSLIVWFDLRRVYETASNRNLEQLKAEILHVLNGLAGWHLSEGRVVISRIYERVENIYRGYSLAETDNQFLMHPFAGFRFDGLLEYDELCVDYSPTPVPSVKTMAVDWVIGQDNSKATITRIIGKSIITGGRLQNNITTILKSQGCNLFNYHDVVNGRWMQSNGNFVFEEDTNYISSQVFPIPRQRSFFLKCPEEIAPSHLRIKAAGGIDAASDRRPMPNAVFTMDSYAASLCDKMVVEIEKEYADFLPEISLFLSNPILDGNFYPYWENVLNLDIIEIRGRHNAEMSIVFPEGLKSCGNVADEILRDYAVKRVASRPYQTGDENNPLLLTDGITTNYPLTQPIIYQIAEIPNVFEIALNGYIRRFPEENNTQLIIEYYDS